MSPQNQVGLGDGSSENDATTDSVGHDVTRRQVGALLIDNSPFTQSSFFGVCIKD